MLTRSLINVGALAVLTGWLLGCGTGQRSSPVPFDSNGGHAGTSAPSGGDGGRVETGGLAGASNVAGDTGTGGQGEGGGLAVSATGGQRMEPTCGFGAGRDRPPLPPLPLCDSTVDAGPLRPYAPGGPASPVVPSDELEFVSEGLCQPFSGCKELTVVWNRNSHELIWADLANDPGSLQRFSDLVGIPLMMQPQCQVLPANTCYEDEVQTHHKLSVQGDTSVELAALTHADVTVGGRPYTVWFGQAYTVSGGKGCCLDAGGFWRGGISVRISR